ncbi:MAG: SGNH/GDSL hydrolase family protein [Nocardioidaceae bacterium]|nr:SGNH/GDSL hydrolase family protein [Nocardioidaceae bacterium]
MTLRREPLLLAALAVVLAAVLVPVLGPGSASGDTAQRCARFAFEAEARQRVVIGRGPRIAVLGDSYTAGLGLTDVARSWPSRLRGRVVAFGFSGSGFSRGASPCRAVSYADRVRVAARAAGTVVVEGGLNDVDQPASDIRSGIRRVLAALRGHRVLVVGPVAAPARASRVGRVDAVLAAECGRAGVAYLSMRDARLSYLADGLHLTPQGHRAFGDLVAARVEGLG